MSAAVANCEEASKELKEAEAQLGRLTAELGQAEAASSPAMEQDVAEAAPKRCRQGESVEAQSAEPDRSAAAPVAEPTVPVADVQVLIAQAVEAAMATAMQVQIQKVMDHFEGQVIALQTSLTKVSRRALPRQLRVYNCLRLWREERLGQSHTKLRDNWSCPMALLVVHPLLVVHRWL